MITDGPNILAGTKSTASPSPGTCFFWKFSSPPGLGHLSSLWASPEHQAANSSEGPAPASQTSIHPTAICTFIYPSICPFIHHSSLYSFIPYLSINPSNIYHYPSAHPFICPSIYPPIHLSLYHSIIYPSIPLPIIQPSICLSLCPSTHLSTCPYICPQAVGPDMAEAFLGSYLTILELGQGLRSKV